MDRVFSGGFKKGVQIRSAVVVVRWCRNMFQWVVVLVQMRLDTQSVFKLVQMEITLQRGVERVVGG